MKRPSFQFYPGDWTTDLALRRCSAAARGVWMDVLCALHNSDDQYGVLRWPLKEIASTIGASMSHVRELVDKGVLKGSDTEITQPLIYTPRHGRKDGEPVTLIDTKAGPLWYSKRLVKDEYIRTTRGESTRFGADEGEAPKTPPKIAPKPPFGDGSSSSSSSPSSSSVSHSVDTAAHSEASLPAETSAAAVLLNEKKPTPEAEMAIALRAEGVTTTSQDVLLLRWVSDGFTTQQAKQATRLARLRKPYPEPIPSAYLDTILRDDKRMKSVVVAPKRFRTAEEIEAEIGPGELHAQH